MNQKKFYFHYFFSSFLPVYPVYALIFEQKGFSVFQISMLFTIWTIPQIVFEIPSGILADRWSRKYSLVLSGILKVVCFLLWFLSDSFFLYAAGFICWGTSSAFHSGAREALLYDSMKICGQESDFDRVYGRCTFISCIGELSACILGGYLSQRINMTVTLPISIGVELIAAGFALSLEEVNLYHKKHEESAFHIKDMIMEQLQFFVKKRTAGILLLMILIVTGTSGVLDEYDQIVVSDFGLSVATVGIWMALRSLVRGLGSLCASCTKRWISRYLRIKKRLSIIAFLAVIGAVSLGLSVTIHKVWSLTLYGFYYFLMAICSVLAEEYLQQTIEEEGRSTIHSILSLFLNLFGTFFFPILGGFFTWRSLTFGIWMISLFTILMVCITSTLSHNLEKKG